MLGGGFRFGAGGGGGVTDHGALTGLGDDDHAQYALDSELATPSGTVTSLDGLSDAGAASSYSRGDHKHPPRMILASVEATTTVVNTTVETNLFSLTLPGGRVTAGDRVIVRAMGDILNNSVGSFNYTLRFKIGATTVLATPGILMAISANRRKWFLEVEAAIESTTAQRVAAFLGASVASASTWDVMPTTGLMPATGYGTSAENTATDKAIVLSVQMATADANGDMRVHAASLELVKK